METIIMERQGSSKEHAREIAKELRQIDICLLPLLNRWLETGQTDDATLYHGYSLNSLMADYGMYFTGALLTLDWIVKDPDAACKVLAEGIY